MPSRSTRWPVRQWLLAAVSATLLMLLPATVAAHAELVLSVPAANSSVTTAPTAVVLEFTEPVDRDTSLVDVLDPSGRSIRGTAQPKLAAGARSLTLDLPRLDPGVYTVTYQVTSASDGHVTSGAFVFQFDPTGVLPPPSVAATSRSPSTDAPTVLARWASLVLLLVLFGTTLFWLVSARPGRPGPNAPASGSPAPAPSTVTPSVVWGALAGLALAALIALAVFLTYAATPIVSSTAGHAAPGPSIDFAAPFGWTSFAIAMRAALAGTGAALLVSTLRFLRKDSPRAWPATADRPSRDPLLLVAVLLCAGVALGGMSFGGHAAATGGLLFAVVDWTHLLAVAAWLGTLGGLALLAWHARGAVGRSAILIAALRRHSRVALVAAPLVAITGLANSPLVIGQVRDVVASEYGNLALAKASLFSLAVAIGAVNFFLVRGRSVRSTAALVSAEAALGLAAVLAAATMLSIQPAASRVPVLSQSTIQAVHLYGTTGTSTVHAAVDIPAPGDQLYEVLVSDPNGTPRTDVQAISLRLTAPKGITIGVRDLTLRPSAEPTVWATRGAYTPVTGDWRLEVLINRTGQPQERAAFPLTVQEPLAAELVPPPDTGIRVPAPLAMLWFLPDGPAGWLLLASLIGLVLASWASERARRWAGAHRRIALARAAVALLTVVVALGIGSRAVVEAANRPTQSAVNPIPASAASIERGRLIYLANCSSCHGTTGSGDGPQAPGMLPAPGAIGSAVASLTDGELRYLVTTGVAGTRMPSFATSLSENDRWDLVNYLRSTYQLDR